MKTIRRQFGFTLVEVVVAMGITMIFFGVITPLSVSLYQSTRQLEQTHQMQTEVNRMMDIISKTIEPYNLDASQALTVRATALTVGEKTTLSFDFERKVLYFRVADEASLSALSFTWIEQVTFSIMGEVLVIHIVNTQGHPISKAYPFIGGLDS